MEKEVTTLQSILQVAKEEFLHKGYREAGLRDISKKAGVTTGALYGYFKNKEELFDALVKEQYDYIMEAYRTTLENFSVLPAERQQKEMADYTYHFVVKMTDYIYEHYDAFKLLLCCSDGTPYANMVHDLAALEVKATNDFMKNTGDAGINVNPVNPTLEHMLTSGMFSTYFEIIIHDIPREEAKEYIRQMLEFYQAGWFKIMGF